MIVNNQGFRVGLSLVIGTLQMLTFFREFVRFYV